MIEFSCNLKSKKLFWLIRDMRKIEEEKLEPTTCINAYLYIGSACLEFKFWI